MDGSVVGEWVEGIRSWIRSGEEWDVERGVGCGGNI